MPSARVGGHALWHAPGWSTGTGVLLRVEARLGAAPADTDCSESCSAALRYSESRFSEAPHRLLRQHQFLGLLLHDVSLVEPRTRPRPGHSRPSCSALGWLRG